MTIRNVNGDLQKWAQLVVTALLSLLMSGVGGVIGAAVKMATVETRLSDHIVASEKWISKTETDVKELRIDLNKEQVRVSGVEGNVSATLLAMQKTLNDIQSDVKELRKERQ